MEIIHEKPPVWDLVREQFPINPNATFFAWGDKIYNPGGIDIPTDILVHESVHSEQQARMGSVEAWWARYLDEPYFRIAQEAEAYGAQYRWLCGVNKDRNRQNMILRQLASQLSGALYGKIINHGAAMRYIKAGKPI